MMQILLDDQSQLFAPQVTIDQVFSHLLCRWSHHLFPMFHGFFSSRSRLWQKNLGRSLRLNFGVPVLADVEANFGLWSLMGWLVVDHWWAGWWFGTSGWWFGCHFLFSHSVGNNHPNWLIFFRGVQTTNQTSFFDVSRDSEQSSSQLTNLYVSGGSTTNQRAKGKENGCVSASFSSKANMWSLPKFGRQTEKSIKIWKCSPWRYGSRDWGMRISMSCLPQGARVRHRQQKWGCGERKKLVLASKCV